VEKLLDFVVKSNNNKVLKLKKHCLGSIKHQGPGIVELTVASTKKDSGEVRVSQHFTSRPKIAMTPILSLSMLMILSIWETTNRWFKSSKNT